MTQQQPSGLQLNPSEISRIDAYRKSKRTAVLTVLFTDIVGSTEASEQLGEERYLKLKYRHDELLRPIIERGEAGLIIKEIGDSFLAVFAEPSTAVQRTIDLQRSLAANRGRLTDGEYQLRVRAGLHMGQVSVENKLTPDIFGRHVNRAARIMSMARPGQVLTSQAVWDNASGWLKEQGNSGIQWKELGKASLKGITGKISLFEFYSPESGSAGMPAPMLKERWRKRVLFIALITILLVAGYFTLRDLSVSPRTDVKPDRPIFYFQGDYSALAEYAGDVPSTYLVGSKRDQAITVDTHALHEEILSAILSVVYPDSVVTDKELTEKAMRSGAIYHRRSIDETEYFMDTLGFSGVMRAQTVFDSSGLPILYFSCRPFGPLNAGHIHGLNEPDVIHDLREFLVNFWMKYKQPAVYMTIIDVQDSTLLLRIKSPPGFRVQPGLSLNINRSFQLDSQRNDYLEYTQAKMHHFSTVAPDSLKYLDAQGEYEFVRDREYDSVLTEGNVFVTGDFIGTARLVEVYDTTGRAEIIRHVQWSRPKAGDSMHFD